MKEENPYYNQSIECSVHNCQFCDCDANKCNLAQIKICNMDSTYAKSSTICDSFMKKN